MKVRSTIASLSILLLGLLRATAGAEQLDLCGTLFSGEPCAVFEPFSGYYSLYPVDLAWDGTGGSIGRILGEKVPCAGPCAEMGFDSCLVNCCDSCWVYVVYRNG